MADVTPEDADEWTARLDGVDLAALAADHARRHDVDPVWRAAVERANARLGSGAAKGRGSHRRGRRG